MSEFAQVRVAVEAKRRKITESCCSSSYCFTCMFACMFARMSSDMEWIDPQIDDEKIAESQPRVRFLMLQRMEQIWAQVEDHLDPDKGVDPRWAEIGVRLLDRYSKLYRLDKPVARDEDEDDLGAGVDRGAIVLAQLKEIEEKLAQARGSDEEGQVPGLS